MKIKKSTNKELIEELTTINVNGRYDRIIAEAKDNQYHDYKNTKYTCGKVQLVSDLSEFPELKFIEKEVMDGIYDESPDEQDKEMMRKDLIEDIGEEQAKKMFKILGL